MGSVHSSSASGSANWASFPQTTPGSPATAASGPVAPAQADAITKSGSSRPVQSLGGGLPTTSPHQGALDAISAYSALAGGSRFNDAGSKATDLANPAAAYAAFGTALHGAGPNSPPISEPHADAIVNGMVAANEGGAGID